MYFNSLTLEPTLCLIRGFLLLLLWKVLMLVTQQPNSPQIPFIISGAGHEMLSHSVLPPQSSRCLDED